ncbi:MAG: MoaF C-terminal domain-containing protein [Acidimicrobiales bacterium]
MEFEPTDPSTWLPLDGLAIGFDANKGATTGELDGRTIVIDNEDGSWVEHVFGSGRVTHTFHPPDAAAPTVQVDAFEAFVVDDALYYAQFHEQAFPSSAVSLFIDDRTNRSLTVVTEIGDVSQPGTRVSQRFVVGALHGLRALGSPPHPTPALVGRRALWIYSASHAYEHIYLSPRWYSWQCLAGPEKGLADTDEVTTYELRPGIYVFTWREKVVPCAAVTVADHREPRGLRSHGALFGLDGSGTQYVHFTFGAYGRLLGVTAHPDDLDPIYEGA